MQKIDIIAEIGVNHGGDLELAKKLIDLSKEGGADAAKFQTYKAGKLAMKNSPSYWDRSKEPTASQFELFKKFDAFEAKDYEALASHCRKVGIEFMSTAFDSESVEFIDPLVKRHKIASADLTNLPLLRQIAGKKKPVLLSTGAATLLEIEFAVNELQKCGAPTITLLHCVLNYPTPADKAHLSRINTLKRFFPEFGLGYSDHTMPGEFCYPVVLACAMGARVIEKHFTHDKTLPGNDHYHAMDVNDLRKLRSKLADFDTLFGPATESAFLNDQTSAIMNARRSIVTARSLKKGTILNNEVLTVKRPASGISPIHWDSIIGKVLARDVDDDQPLQWSDLG